MSDIKQAKEYTRALLEHLDEAGYGHHLASHLMTCLNTLESQLSQAREAAFRAGYDAGYSDAVIHYCEDGCENGVGASWAEYKVLWDAEPDNGCTAAPRTCAYCHTYAESIVRDGRWVCSVCGHRRDAGKARE